LTPLAYIKLICESIIAVPKILGEIKDGYLYSIEAISEETYKKRCKKRGEIDSQIQAESKKDKPNDQTMRDLHRDRYNI